MSCGMEFLHVVRHPQVLHARACQKYFPILNQQYVKTELSYDVEFLHISRHLQEQKIDSIVSSGLTVTNKHAPYTLKNKLALPEGLVEV